jgi:hypothetical protein
VLRFGESAAFLTAETLAPLQRAPDGFVTVELIHQALHFTLRRREIRIRFHREVDTSA